MLFYERVESSEKKDVANNKNHGQMAKGKADSGGGQSLPTESDEKMEVEEDSSRRLEEEVGAVIGTETKSVDQVEEKMQAVKSEKEESKSTGEIPSERPDNVCDIVDKKEMIVNNEVKEPEEVNMEEKVKEDVEDPKVHQVEDKTVSSLETKDLKETKKDDGKLQGEDVDIVDRSPISGICRELEEWIWKDNKSFLQDVNIFDHTYFK